MSTPKSITFTVGRPGSTGKIALALLVGPDAYHETRLVVPSLRGVLELLPHTPLETYRGAVHGGELESAWTEALYSHNSSLGDYESDEQVHSPDGWQWLGLEIALDWGDACHAHVTLHDVAHVPEGWSAQSGSVSVSGDALDGEARKVLREIAALAEIVLR